MDGIRITILNITSCTYPSAGPLDHCNMVDISCFTCSGVFLIPKTHE